MVRYVTNMMVHRVTPEGSLLLSFTTLAHLYAVPFAPNMFYEVVIRLSTFLSFAWHLSNTPALSPLGVLDHACAALWFLTDCWMAWNGDIFVQILVANGIIAAMSWSLPFLEQKGIVTYAISCSIWHLLSAAKAVYVAASLNFVETMHAA